MDDDTKFYSVIGVSIIVIIALAVWELVLQPINIKGQVSSFRQTYALPSLFCTDKIEFYGGMENEVWCNQMAEQIVKPNAVCEWDAKGMYLQNVSCG